MGQLPRYTACCPPPSGLPRERSLQLEDNKHDIEVQLLEYVMM